jgi:hypothetical protein
MIGYEGGRRLANTKTYQGGDMLNDKQHLTENEEVQFSLSEMTDEALDDLIASGSEGSLNSWDDA